MAARHAEAAGDPIDESREQLRAKLAASRVEMAAAVGAASSAARQIADWRGHGRNVAKRHPLALTGVVALVGFALARSLRGGSSRKPASAAPAKRPGSGIIAALGSTALLVFKPALVKIGSRALENWVAARSDARR